MIEVDLAAQTLTLQAADGRQYRYPVSTAARGPGNLRGSFCTPTGLLRVRLKIGAGAPAGTVFVGRRPTGERHDPRACDPARDWILTRILWLDGLQPGVNRGGAHDTLRRFVYIHGTHDEAHIGQPVSHGCIRMTSRDVIDLFDRVDVGCPVRVDVTPPGCSTP